MDDIYNKPKIHVSHLENQIGSGKITEKDKFLAAKQILLGLAILYIFTILAYLYKPVEAAKLIDITLTTFPPLATLILVAYFRDKNSN